MLVAMNTNKWAEVGSAITAEDVECECKLQISLANRAYYYHHATSSHFGFYFFLVVLQLRPPAGT